ncbi:MULTISPECIES: hypothetical protein [Moorena]|nr:MULTISPECIES: hypothetical protein [Moorena]NEP35298.1 hypothetical protein [Moorena sp. SIO3B2]NEP69262.1 hypothetical protein [Moorena sp. SIO3A5]NEQ08089.1 hypothetical protein [Moorena sp. SIO4E2]NER89655.1 hypothetical protein [Moorena sp. SIO3A2]NES44574.1 hypothetical protein [Moorena sp. SIO2C4]
MKKCQGGYSRYTLVYLSFRSVRRSRSVRPWAMGNLINLLPYEEDTG